jgi:hypothetical protein
MLTLIGHWITDLDDQSLPAPQGFVRHMWAAERARLADYLAAGMVHESYPGYSWCRFEFDESSRKCSIVINHICLGVPRGKRTVIELFGMGSPNVRKVGIMLEEVGLDYVLRHVAVFRGDQFEPVFLALNPLGKVPVLIDHTRAPGTPIYESGAILFYLAGAA